MGIVKEIRVPHYANGRLEEHLKDDLQRSTIYVDGGTTEETRNILLNEPFMYTTKSGVTTSHPALTIGLMGSGPDGHFGRRRSEVKACNSSTDDVTNCSMGQVALAQRSEMIVLVGYPVEDEWVVEIWDGPEFIDSHRMPDTVVWK